MRAWPWRTILTVLFSLWAISGALHILTGLFDDYERMSGRSRFFIEGGSIQLVIALGLLVAVRTFRR